MDFNPDFVRQLAEVAAPLIQAVAPTVVQFGAAAGQAIVDGGTSAVLTFAALRTWMVRVDKRDEAQEKRLGALETKMDRVCKAVGVTDETAPVLKVVP